MLEGEFDGVIGQNKEKGKRLPMKHGVLSIWFVGVAVYVAGNISACSFFQQGRWIYDREGIYIGVEADPSIGRSSPQPLNAHPIDLTPRDIETLLQVIQVSGYSGTLVGLVTRPQAVPLFTPKELSTISGPLASAFRAANQNERVSFSLPKPDVTYSEDRTVGVLFFRGPYLHVILTDHASIIRTDTGGGDARDIRDTKGMQLSVTTPIKMAIVPDVEQPRWMPFETIHLSINSKEVLARKERIPVSRTNEQQAVSPPLMPPASRTENRQEKVSPEDLQHQIQDLSNTNQVLQGRLDQQNKQIQELQNQMERLRRKLPQSAPKSTPYKTPPIQ